ncbi:hypothetical protein Q7P37_000325 [Cladosporium fusiforme]
MTTLLSLPNEILLNIFATAPTTRTLLHLSRVNRRMRTIWLEHSQHIVVSAYKTRTPHIEQAITLTLAEAQSGEIIPLPPADSHITAPGVAREPSPIGFCLSRLLRNAGLASSFCHAASIDNKLQKISWQTEDPRIEMLRAYYLVRHTLLAYNHPELRPSVSSALVKCTKEMHSGNNWAYFFMVAAAPKRLKETHGVTERNLDAWDGTNRDPYQERLKLVDRWRVVGRVFAEAECNYHRGWLEPLSFEILDLGFDD